MPTRAIFHISHVARFVVEIRPSAKLAASRKPAGYRLKIQRMSVITSETMMLVVIGK
jgi:hypothetical protein